MNIESNVTELFGSQPAIANDEDFLVLLDNDEDYICYVRNYVSSFEFIVVSNSIMRRLPKELQPITNVFVPSSFHALRQFKGDIRQYILQSNQLSHFYYLFNSSMTDFFDSL
ncbi:hypothetical protein [Glaciecola sp. 1036]|uniref:hypothetical protein n=1 Tax=Alteromonadaceae TaxID=72275 RepID=UPI003D02585C|tara:strand:+ start:873 stop:1208 length:336 start_codon:yes stop_codon:yes gene_type:complete